MSFPHNSLETAEWLGLLRGEFPMAQVMAEQGGDPAMPEQSRLVLPTPHCDNIQRENSMLPSSPSFLPALPTWGLQTEKTISSPVMDGQNFDDQHREADGEMVAPSSFCWTGTSEMPVAFYFPANRVAGQDEIGEHRF